MKSGLDAMPLFLLDDLLKWFSKVTNKKDMYAFLKQNCIAPLALMAVLYNANWIIDMFGESEWYLFPLLKLDRISIEIER